MRCSLRSYLRWVIGLSSFGRRAEVTHSIVDPILAILLPLITSTEKTIIECGEGASVVSASYAKRFDAAKIHHVLENLLSLARFGGQGFTRITKAQAVAQSHDPQLRKLLKAGKLSRSL